MKFSLVLLVLISMSLFAIASCTQSNPASAPKIHMNDNMTMESSMNDENMADLGKLMMRMGDILEKHKMTDGQHIKCARFIDRLGKIMMMCAVNVDSKSVDKQKSEIKDLTQGWNYFERGTFEEH
jgi:hypothetical protein